MDKDGSIKKAHYRKKNIILMFSLGILAGSGIVFLYYQTRNCAIERAEHRIQDILLHYRAVHQYIQKDTHPAMYRLKRTRLLPKNFYSPAMLSSSYMIRVVHSYYNNLLGENQLPELRYKMAALNPRNPVNQANSFEEQLIKKFNDDHSIKEHRQLLTINGKQYLYYALPFLENNEACLQCHGNPRKAPARLRHIYGLKGGFNEKAGQIRAIESIHVPIESELDHINIIFSGAIILFVTLVAIGRVNMRLQGLIKNYATDLEQANQNLEQEIEKRKIREQQIRDINSDLEQKIQLRTGELIKAYSELETASRDSALKENRFAELNKQLLQSNKELQSTLKQVSDIQNKLIETEKMAALGRLVAGISHEISSPLGTCLSAASHLESECLKISDNFINDAMTRSGLQDYIKTVNEAVRIIMSNIHRATDLMKSFKSIAVDQTNLEKRSFPLKDYFEEIVLSLKPNLSKGKHRVQLDIPESIYITSYPGAFAQILTNLINNSIDHGFTAARPGKINITAHKTPEYLIINYTDNGKGMSFKSLQHIFEPFYTTAKKRGGSGLGMSIVYNLVTKTLNGDISCTGKKNMGMSFKIVIPCEDNKKRTSP